MFYSVIRIILILNFIAGSAFSQTLSGDTIFCTDMSLIYSESFIYHNSFVIDQLGEVFDIIDLDSLKKNDLYDASYEVIEAVMFCDSLGYFDSIRKLPNIIVNLGNVSPVKDDSIQLEYINLKLSEKNMRICNRLELSEPIGLNVYSSYAVTFILYEDELYIFREFKRDRDILVAKEGDQVIFVNYSCE